MYTSQRPFLVYTTRQKSCGVNGPVTSSALKRDCGIYRNIPPTYEHSICLSTEGMALSQNSQEETLSLQWELSTKRIVT